MFDAANGVVGLVSRTHRAIAPPVFTAIPNFVYGCVNAGVTAVGAVTDLALTATGLGQHYRPLQATAAGRRAGAVLNGAVGNSLIGPYAALATPTRLRHQGVDLLGELAKLFPGFTPASARSWANTGWSADARFKGC